MRQGSDDGVEKIDHLTGDVTDTDLVVRTFTLRLAEVRKDTRIDFLQNENGRI